MASQVYFVVFLNSFIFLESLCYLYLYSFSYEGPILRESIGTTTEVPSDVVEPSLSYVEVLTPKEETAPKVLGLLLSRRLKRRES